MAAESGEEITWEQALASDLVLAPGLANLTTDTTPPVAPDAQGHHPVSITGVTKML
ncbi:MAG: hypothetical protein HY718_06725 [Planctomycetes bacterium]|nr:hypothetical protein [Planctomycetota bacterium]